MKVWKRPFFDLIKVGSETFADLINGLFDGIRIGSQKHELKQSSAGHLHLKAIGTGKSIYQFADDKVYYSIGGVTTMYATTNGMEMRNGKKQTFQNTGNTLTNAHEIGDDGSGNLEMKVTEAGKNIELDAKSVLANYIDGTIKTGLTASNFNIYNGVYLSKIGPNGTKMDIYAIYEQVTIPVGNGAAGVDTTAFIPAGCTVKRVVGRVTQAPGNPGVCTTFNACIKADANASLGNAVSTALDTTFNNLSSGDGNRSDPWGQKLAVEITTTTNADVDTSDMKIRYVIFYERFVEPTG